MSGHQEASPISSIHVVREPAFTPMSPRKREICWNFGLPPREPPFTLVENLSIPLRPGHIVLIVGPSGSGKSSVLAAVAEQVPDCHWVGHHRFPADGSIVDAIAALQPLATALELLTACGLGEPRLWIRAYRDLSEGEQLRASLARTLGLCLARRRRPPILCDEFTTTLHRRAARAVAYNLRKLVTRERLTLVVATAHDDLVDDLRPDQLIRFGPGGVEVAANPPDHQATISLHQGTHIEPGSVADYHQFSLMHYRHRDGLGFVDRVFVLREKPGGEPLGILVFAHAPLELAMRNRCTEGRFVRNPWRLNRELRILRRLVMHPDIRGCGLGHWFVKNTLPRVGVRFVECLAAMGAINPVFEKAGLRRVGPCPPPRGRLTLLRRMERWSVDPFAPDFTERIARSPRVRRLVEDTIRQWASRTQGARPYRVTDRTPDELAGSFRQIVGRPPVYYLWDREGVYPRIALADPNIDKNSKLADDRSSPSSDEADRHRPLP